MEEKIREKIIKELQPNFLQIENKSYLHAGHKGIEGNNSSETHFMVKISSPLLLGLTKIKAHQKINKALKQEFENGLHALEIKIIT